METKDAKEYNDWCGSETDRLSLREEISGVIQTRPILRRRGWPWVHFLANAKQLSALDVANLYKKRWLLEPFFKWLKQHLKIMNFWDTTENAVHIQIGVAIITSVLWLLSNMTWSWNARPMKSCKFSAYHWLTKPTCVTYSTRLISMVSKL